MQLCRCVVCLQVPLFGFPPWPAIGATGARAGGLRRQSFSERGPDQRLPERAGAVTFRWRTCGTAPELSDAKRRRGRRGGPMPQLPALGRQDRGRQGQGAQGRRSSRCCAVLRCCGRSRISAHFFGDRSRSPGNPSSMQGPEVGTGTALSSEREGRGSISLRGAIPLRSCGSSHPRFLEEPKSFKVSRAMSRGHVVQARVLGSRACM